MKASPSRKPPTPRERRRSLGFLETNGASWACFLATFQATGSTWHGYIAFRPSHSELSSDEVRTTHIFLENSEAQIHDKARGLGRPLLNGLLDSALHTKTLQKDEPTPLRGQFKALLNTNSAELAGDWLDEHIEISKGELERLRSLYESYRIDQVCHFILLVDADDFGRAVDRILERERIDFRTKDRVQFARIVIDYIESLLPLPDFKSWAQDFLAHPESYRLYTHTLHREGRLP